MEEKKTFENPNNGPKGNVMDSKRSRLARDLLQVACQEEEEREFLGIT
jgi:hypothetical protein